MDPRMPVIDSVVLQNLSLRPPARNDPRRLENICGLYHAIGEQLKAFSESPAGRDSIAAFRAAYPVDGVTDIKIIDLLLWQTRSAPTTFRAEG
jgi:hypothetical protein